jgi:hypothetical protein
MSKLYDKVLEFLIPAAIICIVSPFAVLLYRAFQWLRTGQNPEITLASIGIPQSFQTDWVGFQSILNGLFNMPIEVILMGVFCLLVWIITRDNARD